MALTPLPTPPSTSDPANFATRADAFVAALATMVTEINAGGAVDWASPGAAIGTGTPVAGTFLAISGTTGTFTDEINNSKDASGGTFANRITQTNADVGGLAAWQVKTGASANIWQFFARNGDGFIGQAGVVDAMQFSGTTGAVTIPGTLYVAGALTANTSIVMAQVPFTAGNKYVVIDTATGQLKVSALGPAS